MPKQQDSLGKSRFMNCLFVIFYPDAAYAYVRPLMQSRMNFAPSILSPQLRKHVFCFHKPPLSHRFFLSMISTGVSYQLSRQYSHRTSPQEVRLANVARHKGNEVAVTTETGVFIKGPLTPRYFVENVPGATLNMMNKASYPMVT